MFSLVPVTYTTPRTTLIMSTGILLQPANIVEVPISQAPMVVLKQIISNKNSIRIRPQAPKANAGKIAIPALKVISSRIKEKRKRIRRKKHELNKHSKNALKLAETNIIYKNADTATEIIAIPNTVELNTVQIKDTSNKRRNSDTFESPIELNKCKKSKENEKVECQVTEKSVNKCQLEIATSKCNAFQEKENESKRSSGAARSPNLSQDILESLRIPQHESNHESLSPTAAFLLSFPVVATSGGRTDVDIQPGAASPSLLNLDDLSGRDKHNDNALLDNISSLFTTRDYDRFVEDVAKSEQNLSSVVILNQKIEDTFDFQLKPITNEKKIDVSTSLLTPDISSGSTISSASTIFNIGSAQSEAGHSSLATVPKIFINPSLFPSLPSVASSSIIDCSEKLLVNNNSIKPHTFDFLNKNTLKEDTTGQRDASGMTSMFTFSLTNTTPMISSYSAPIKSTTATSSKLHGFYDSLSSIGTSAHNNSVSSNIKSSASSNAVTMYTSALSLSSSASCSKNKLIETSNFSPQTPFTFSLTTTSSACSAAKASQSSFFPNQISSVTTSTSDSILYGSSTLKSSKPAAYQHPQDSYNPFAFDNVPTMPSVRENSQFTFSLSNTANNTIGVPSNKPITHHSTTLNPFSIDYNILPDAKSKIISPHLPFSVSSAVTPVPPPIVSIPPLPPQPPPPLPCMMDQKKTENKNENSLPYYQQHSNDQSSMEKFTKPKITQFKPPVNWMTSTVTEEFNPAIPPPIDLAQNTSFYPKSDIYFAHPSSDEHFPWSPNKLLDNTSININSCTLPNLHGDLALNTFSAKPHLSTIVNPKREKKIFNVPAVSSTLTLAPVCNDDPSTLQITSSTSLLNPSVTNNHLSSQGNFFSVSQLVDQRKSNAQLAQPQNTIKQGLKQFIHASSRSKLADSRESKRSNILNEAVKSIVPNVSSNIFVDSFSYSYTDSIAGSKQSNISNIYSAEALLSTNCPSSSSYKHKEKHFSSNYVASSDFIVGSVDHLSAMSTSTTTMPTFSNMDYMTNCDGNYSFFNSSNYLAQNCIESDYLGASSGVFPATTDVAVKTIRSSHPHQPTNHSYPFNTVSKESQFNQQRDLVPFHNFHQAIRPTNSSSIHKINTKQEGRMNQQSYNSSVLPTSSANCFSSGSLLPVPPPTFPPPTSFVPARLSTHHSLTNSNISYSSQLQNHLTQAPYLSAIEPSKGNYHPYQTPPGLCSSEVGLNTHLHIQKPQQYNQQQSNGSSSTGHLLMTHTSGPSNLVSNFNLSTICPEINDKVRQHNW